MGTNTEFQGAVRISPRVEPSLAERFERWFAIRHMRRDVAELLAAFPNEEDRKAHSLMGDGQFGLDGLYYLPDEIAEISPALAAFHNGTNLEGIADMKDISNPPAGAPSLYCDLFMVPSVKENCSYLGWNGSEKSYAVSDWIEMIAKLLVPLGYHLDGRVLADEEGMNYYVISVLDESVQTISIDLPSYTYDWEFGDALRDRENGVTPETTPTNTDKAGHMSAPTLYVDLDGTLAEWKPAAKPEELLEEGYFLNLQPHENVVAAVQTLIAMGVKVYILSAYLADSLYAVEEKHAWVAKYLPELPTQNVWLTPCTIEKPMCVLSHGESMEQAVLLDDYTKNLNAWVAYGGHGVKLRNGVNGTHGTWTGPDVHLDQPPEAIVELLKGLLNM